MPASEFEEIESSLLKDGASHALSRLSGRLRAQKKYHELFDVRLMQARQRLGLPLISLTQLDGVPEPLRQEVESAYREACREVGELFLADQKLREAWLYLRPIGEIESMRQAIQRIEPTESTQDELIELSLHEGVDPPRGFELLLEHRGICSAITAFESIVAQRSRDEQKNAAAQLVRSLHRELTDNVRADLEQQQGKLPVKATLAELLGNNDQLLAGGNYHTDITHLAAVVKIARVLEDLEVLRLALDLTEYGRRIDPQFQYPGEEPFVDVYAHYGLMFAALLGQRVDEAMSHFQARAESLRVEEDGTQAAEVYVYLLSRLGRHREALEASVRLLPPDIRTSGFAPSVWDLSRGAKEYGTLIEMCRARGDTVSFVAALIEQHSSARNQSMDRGK